MTEDEKKKAAAIAAGISVAAYLIWALRRKAQQPDKAMLYGEVTEEGTDGIPIKDIVVQCNGYTGKTNADGLYEILNIEPGTYTVTFTDPHLRYEEATV